MMTPNTQSLVSASTSAGIFDGLMSAVKSAGFIRTLKSSAAFTVFAPNDEAFAKLPKETIEDLLKPINKAKLLAIFTYHIVVGKVMAADVKTMKAKTLNGKELDIKVAGGLVTINNANIIKSDVASGNGVIHVIDSVLMPK